MERTQELLRRLIPALAEIFGDRVNQIILYGSVARGTQTSESDLDVALIVRGYTEEMHSRMTDLAVELELEFDCVISLVLIDYQNYLEWEDVLPFYRNVKKDGIILWPAA